jgi:signal peptidase
MTPLRWLGRRARTLVLWIVLGAVFGALLAATAPLLIGDRSFTVRSGSMTPAIETGDVLVTEPVAPLEAKVGDVVTFLDPEGSGRLISHRVQSLRRVGDAVSFVTRGDANTSTEHWNVPADGSVGKVVYRVPRVGYVLVWAGTVPARIGLIVVPALLLSWIAPSRIWRPARETEEDAP